MVGVKHKRGQSCIRVKTAIGAEAVQIAEGYRAVKGLFKNGTDRRSNEEGERIVHKDKVYAYCGKLRMQVG